MTTRSNAAAPARRGDAGPATRTVAGIGLMVLAILLFTVMDTLGKDLTGRYPVLSLACAVVPDLHDDRRVRAAACAAQPRSQSYERKRVK